jgi:hypothetical protein
VLLASSIAAAHDDPRRHSADWFAAQREDTERRVAEEQKRLEHEAALQEESRRAYESRLPR